MGTLFHPDGRRETVTPENADGEWSLEELQKHVEGYIERVPAAPGRPEAYCNEEGLITGQKANIGATLALGVELLVGPVVILDKEESLP
jgi:hypothetical protein